MRNNGNNHRKLVLRTTIRGIDPDVLADLAHEVGVPRGDFEIVFADEQTKQETIGEFQYAQRSGIQGFPTVVGVDGETQPIALTMGYRPWEAMEPAVEGWLSGQDS